MTEIIFQDDPNETNYGKAYAVNAAGHVVLVGGSHPATDRRGAVDFDAFKHELKPGWRWATAGDLAAARSALDAPAATNPGAPDLGGESG